MPDVGVLQLKIAANVSSATTSLKTLSDRLSAINKATENFQLGNVATQIQQIVDTVKGDKSVSTAVKNLGSLLNAISGFSKVTKIGLNKTQIKQLSDLQTAVNGFNLGNSGTQLNKIREALGGEWNTEQAAKAKDVLDTLAQGAKSISDSGTAEKIKDVSKSLGDITGGTAGNVSKATDEIVDYQKVVNELGDTLKNAQVTFKEPLMRVNLGQFGEKPTSIPQFENASVQSWRDEMAGIRGVNDELKQTDATSINNIGDLQRALSELGKIKGADGLMRFADGINAITAAMQSSGESYLTLGRLASAINKFKDATSGFSIPSFAKLESLARTLQDNFNAENGLKRMADGINAFKAATHGMDLSNAKGISAILKSMNANASQSSGTVSAMKAVSDSISTASASNTSAGFAETSERIAEVAVAAEAANESTQKLDFSVFDPANLPLGALGMTLDEFRRGGGEAVAFKDALEDTGNIVRELRQNQEEVAESTYKLGEAINGVPVDEFNRQMAETNETVNHQLAEKYRSVARSLEDVYNGIYNGKKREVDLASQWLHGNGTENEQLYALQHTAAMFGMTVDELKAKIAELKAAESELSNDTGAGAENRFQRIDNAIEGVISRFSELIQGTGSLKGSISRMFPTLSGLFNRFKQLVKYRALRAIIKQISEGFQEGTENYYYYSQAIGGTFATSMDNAASSLLTMKNSIGAAVAPLISSLIPYLQTVVNLFVEAVNYVNQFFALLNGQSTWSKATAATATAFDDISDSASGASDSINDLLADWDELNIIQSESSGSGSGTGTNTAEDYASMFEEVSDYNETIKNIVDFIKENFDEILKIVEEIGAALLLWKFSNAFSGLIGNLAGLAAAGLTAAVIFEVSTLFNNQYLKTGDIGWLVADVLSTLIGTVLMKKILSKVLGGQLATLAIPLALTVSAVAGIVTVIGNNDVSALSKEALIASAENSLKTAFAAGYLLKNVAGYSMTQSVFGGLGVGITTFGVVIGLKAIAQTMDTKEFTSEIIGADFLAAGLVGTGIALTEWALGTGGVISALTLGGGAALFTLGALIAVEALIVLNKNNPVQWGDYEATKEEIDAFVSNRVFSVSAESVLKLINPKIEAVTADEETLSADVGEVRLLATKIRLGISDEELRNDIEEQVFGVNGEGGIINDFKQTARSKQELIEVGMTLVPVGGINDDGTTKAMIDETSEAWKLLTDHMDDLGTKLSTHLANAYKENISKETQEMELETVSKIMTMMSNVSAAIAGGEAWSAANQTLTENLKNLTQGSWDELFSAIESYREEIVGAYATAYDSATNQVAGQMWALQQSINNEQELINLGIGSEAKLQAYQAEYDQVKAIYDARVAGRDQALKDAESGAFNQETKELIEESFKSVIGDSVINSDNILDELSRSAGLTDTMNTLYTLLFADNGTAKEDARGILTDWMNGIIENAYAGDSETILNGIKSNMASYSTFFSQDLIDELANAIGISGASPEIQTAWQELVDSILAGDTIVSEPTTIETPLDIIPTAFSDGSEMAFDLVFTTNTDELKNEIQNDLNSAGPVNVPTNADFSAGDATQGQPSNGNWFGSSFESLWSSAMANATTAPNQAFSENGMFGTITINTERNDEQDTNNIAEGTKRGNVGLEAKLGQLNSTMSQLNGNVVNIATKIGGGLTNIGNSATGSLINNALNAFNMVRG